MKRVIVALLLLGACVREPATIPVPGEACFEGADHCSVDDDCGLSARTLCRDGWCVITDICLNDRDCREGGYCDIRRGICQLDSECLDTITSTDCPNGEHCVLDFERFRCTDSLEGVNTFATVRASFAAFDEPVPPFVPHLEATFDGVGFTSTNDPGADLYRVRFDGWTVWSTSPPTFSVDDLGVDLLPTRARAEAIVGGIEAPRAISSHPIE